MQDLYTENDKILLRETKNHLNKRYSMFVNWKILYCEDGHSLQIDLKIQHDIH